MSSDEVEQQESCEGPSPWECEWFPWLRQRRGTLLLLGRRSLAAADHRWRHSGASLGAKPSLVAGRSPLQAMLPTQRAPQCRRSPKGARG